RSSFRQAVELIENNIAARKERYSIPWVLVLNEGRESRQLPIEQSGVASALSTETASAAATQGISWHFFDKGVVIDMQGAYLGSPDDEDATQRPWDEFLGLCRNYRPQRPFDSVVITVPAASLLDSSPDALLELGKMAQLAHRRLWLAQNRFAMRFAIYVVVSDCEQVEGFAAFAKALPEPMKAGMLGWSSPYDLSTTYQGEWVDEAMDNVVRTVSDTSAELFALDSGNTQTARFFLLPSRIDRVRESLRAYIDELMRPSAYHEPFFFRGIYLTGDSSESAQRAGARAAGLPGAAADADADAEIDVVSQLMREPTFLRDLFEKKIFMEYGVARPSRQQLARPTLSRAAQWGAAVVLGAWTLGLVVAGVQLNRRNPDLAKELTQIEIDANYRARASDRGEAIPPEWYRAKTLSLLAKVDKLDSDRAWTFFMPGAWDIFDNLDSRVAERIEREFGELAIRTLRRELYARAADLTGVVQDASTSELIIGGDCAAPGGFAAIANAPRKASVMAEDLPELAAMNQYVAAVERLDQALVAMVRLQKPNPTAPDDLRLLVKYTLGAELPGNLTQSIRFFQGDENHPPPSAVSVRHIQQAVRCTLDKGMNALDQRLFANNDLLVAERQLGAQGIRLFAGEADGGAFADTVRGYQSIVALIRDEETLVGGGKGAWMRQSTAELGPAYEALLARITQSRRMLGQDAAEPARQHAMGELQRFRTEFNTRFGAGAPSALVWNDKEMRFSISPERLALRDALAGLLAQPFMAPATDRAIPAPPEEGVLTWNTAKLDQGLALAEPHKAFFADSLAKFPVPVRASVSAVVNAQFARLMSDAAIDSLTIVERPDAGVIGDAAAFDASRTRLAKLQELLAATGAPDKADALRALMSHDALLRLRQMDAKLNQTELYAIRGRNFADWPGDRGPVLQAFGVPDVGGLMQYLALQFSRAEALGRQSETYLASLDRSAAESQLAQRWRAINRELERYRLKNPNGTLGAYEQFLITVGAEIDRFTCSEKLAGKAPASRPADYFGERHLQVYNALAARCAELQTGELQDLWSSFSGDFNRLLASRMPFALSTSRDSSDADIEDVGQMTRTFDKIARTLKQAPTTGRAGTNLAPVRRFAEQFTLVKGFLAPLFPVEEGAVAGYDMAVEFRANRGAEIEGNKIIEWTLDVGGQTLKLRDAPRPLRWEPGTPIVLTLRLAKDAPVTAVFDPQQPQMAAEGKTVTYRFADTWSLLRLIQAQRDAGGAAAGEGRSQLLRLEFPLADAGGATGDKLPAQSRVRVYMRLTLSAVGKRTPVFWPGTFPSRAPEFKGP
ncbi:MAG: type secretion protein IcmF, partial [Ramlibacter sp.]|nr:type secretion protein IcmF [Ramlibacter sp.]